MDISSTEIEEKIASLTMALHTMVFNSIGQLINDNRRLMAELENAKVDIQQLKKQLDANKPEPALSQK